MKNKNKMLFSATLKFGYEIVIMIFYFMLPLFMVTNFLYAQGTSNSCITIGGTDTDAAASLINTSDGGYAMSGFTTSGGLQHIYIVKMDATGSLQWTRKINEGSSQETAHCIIQTSDGGYAVVGNSSALVSGHFDEQV